MKYRIHAINLHDRYDITVSRNLARYLLIFARYNGSLARSARL